MGPTPTIGTGELSAQPSRHADVCSPAVDKPPPPTRTASLGFLATRQDPGLTLDPSCRTEKKATAWSDKTIRTLLPDLVGGLPCFLSNATFFFRPSLHLRVKRASSPVVFWAVRVWPRNAHTRAPHRFAMLEFLRTDEQFAAFPGG